VVVDRFSDLALLGTQSLSAFLAFKEHDADLWLSVLKPFQDNRVDRAANSRNVARVVGEVGQQRDEVLPDLAGPNVAGNLQGLISGA
jgi:hypothetical protein